MKSGMMKSSQADAETIETLTEMQASCETAVNILNDLLSYEKLDAGLLKLDQTMCPVLPLIRGMLGPFSIQVNSIFDGNIIIYNSQYVYVRLDRWA